MLGLFIFILFFTVICLLISKPKQAINLESAKSLQKQNNNKTKERRHNTTEHVASQRVIFLSGFEPLGLLTSCSSASNNQATSAITSDKIIAPESRHSDDEKCEYVTLHPYQEKREKLQAGSFNNSTSSNYSTNNFGEDAAYAAGGAAVGAGVAATVGGMGLAVGGTAIGIGAAPMVAAGTITGLAFSGAKRAIDEGDTTALGAVAGGAAIGAGVSAVVGGMGLAVGGTAVAVGMAPVAAVGAVIGLAAYGLSKLMGGNH